MIRPDLRRPERPRSGSRPLARNVRRIGTALSLVMPFLLATPGTVHAATTCTVTAVGDGYHVEITAAEGATVAVGIEVGLGSPGRPFEHGVHGEIDDSTLEPSTGLFSPFRLCAGDAHANTKQYPIRLSLRGTEDGDESFVVWYAHKVQFDDVLHVDDTVDDLTLSYGAIPSPPYPVAVDFLVDMDLYLATARDGTLVGTTAYWVQCNLVIPSSATLTVVGGSNPYRLSVLGAYGREAGACEANDGVAETIADDVPATRRAFTGDLTYLGGTGRGDVFGPGTGTSTFMAGDGLNSLRYHYARRAVTVDLRAGTAKGWGVQTFSGIVDVYGSHHDDVIIGNSQGNWLYGLSGNDRVRGGGGDDRLDGNEGDDRLAGGAGDDLLIGAQGSDICIGGGGADDFVKCELRKQ